MAVDIEAFARCAAATTRALQSGAAADIDTAMAELRRVPASQPGRGHLAAGLLTVLMRTGTAGLHGMDYLAELMAIAESDPPPSSDWPRLRAGARALTILHDAALGKIVDVDVARAEVDTLATQAGDDPRLADLFTSVRASLTFLRSMSEGNPAAAAHRLLGQMSDLGPAQNHPQLAQLQKVLVEAAGAMKAAHHDPAGIWQAMDQLQEAVDALPPGHFMRDVMAQTQAQMGVFQGYRPGTDDSSAQWQAPTPQQWQALTQLANQSGAAAADRARSHLALGGAELGVGKETDLAKIDAGIAHFREALALTGRSDPVHAFALQSLALALWRRTEITGTTAGLDEAVRVLQEARLLLGGAHHPQWSFLAELESNIQRRLGQLAESTQRAFDGQRGYSWQALLQPDTATTMLAIKNTAADALDLARRCLADGDPAGALHALDAGRGLMLFAATEVRGMARRLREGGHAELAARWETAAGGADTPSEDLRREVLAVLAKEAETLDSLLDPPSFADIQAALTAMQADALVYLVPAASPMPGWAVIAPAAGPPSYMALPELALDADVDRYLFALADRSRAAEPDPTPANGASAATRALGPANGAAGRLLGPANGAGVAGRAANPAEGAGAAGRVLGPAEGAGVAGRAANPADGAAVAGRGAGAAERGGAGGAGFAAGQGGRDLEEQGDGVGLFADSLEKLCDWAWRAAMGPLLERYLGLPATPADGAVPRLVLVPVGDLARIPWHAARHRNGTYALQVAAFTQAVSARLLCDNAARPPVPLSGLGLIVGDPDTAGRAQPLGAARREAYAIRQAFYQGARYVGRRPDGSPSASGAGTAEEVRRWLASPALSAGTMLHLACHGSVRLTKDDSAAYLLLAQGSATDAKPADLHAEELVRIMGSTAARDLGLVVLAACNTGRSVHGYDEAYSLGTAFLAGRVRSVLSTQWSVPDVATSALMFMFHHYLRHKGMPPWEALRQGQLWMLDPHREPPEHMPAYLHPETSGADHTQVVAWAGFVHWGQ